MFNFNNPYIEYGFWTFMIFWVIPYIIAIPLSLLSLQKSPHQKWILGVSIILSPVVTGIIYLWAKKLKGYSAK